MKAVAYYRRCTDKFDSRIRFLGFLGLFAIVGILPLIAGCGIYSMSIYPETPSQIMNKQEPLDLSVSLKELTVYDVGVRMKLSQKQLTLVNKTFSEEMEKARLFREILPRGEDTDVILNKRYADTIAMSSNPFRELFKWTIWGAVAMVLPIPYPYDFGVEGIIELRAPVAGKELFLRQYNFSYEATVWSISLWGLAMNSDPYIEEIARYVARELSKKILKDYEFFKEYARLKKANDIEGIRKLIPEVWSGAK